jgi:hypothetical protein
MILSVVAIGHSIPFQWAPGLPRRIESGEHVVYLLQTGEYLAALSKVRKLESKAARLERMVVILRVHDFLRRSNHSLVKCADPKAGAPAHQLPDIAYTQSLDMWTETIGLDPGPKST